MNEETGQPQNETVERPDYIPEKFWDGERNEVNVEALGSSYKSLESKLGQRTEDLTKSIREDISKEQRANVPEGDYELVAPDIPEGVEVNLEPDLPLVKWWGDFARANIATSANNVKVLEEIMGLTKDAPMPKEDTKIDVDASEDDLRAMMRDPRYWDDTRRDNAYISRVTKLYEQKYGTAPAKL